MFQFLLFCLDTDCWPAPATLEVLPSILNDTLEADVV
jgi:hypothetical protein